MHRLHSRAAARHIMDFVLFKKSLYFYAETMRTKSSIDKITYEVIGLAIKIHKELGPGLLESIYHRCMEHELRKNGILFISEIIVPLKYDDLLLDSRLKCDLLVENCLVVELKAVEALLPIHEAQVLTYMKLLSAPKGLIINFNTENIFYRGQKTLVNHLFKHLEDI